MVIRIWIQNVNAFGNAVIVSFYLGILNSSLKVMIFALRIHSIWVNLFFIERIIILHNIIVRWAIFSLSLKRRSVNFEILNWFNIRLWLWSFFILLVRLEKSWRNEILLNRVCFSLNHWHVHPFPNNAFRSAFKTLHSSKALLVNFRVVSIQMNRSWLLKINMVH